MNSKQIAILILTTALLSAAISAVMSGYISKHSTRPDYDQSTLIGRFEKIETELLQEREARIALQNLLTRQNSIVASSNNLENRLDADDQRIEGNSLVAESFQEPQLQEPAVINPTTSRVDLRKAALINTGLTEDEASYILRSESDQTLEQLNKRYEAQRLAFEQADAQDRSTLAQTNPLRAKLGDDYYAKYLEANGFPTSARVNSVIESSPAFNAGLQAGDRITAYGGQRVFNLNEVANLTYQGTPGESVLLEIERDGEALQLTIPRGPVGVSSGRNRFRR